MPLVRVQPDTHALLQQLQRSSESESQLRSQVTSLQDRIRVLIAEYQYKELEVSQKQTELEQWQQSHAALQENEGKVNREQLPPALP